MQNYNTVLDLIPRGGFTIFKPLLDYCDYSDSSDVKTDNVTPKHYDKCTC